MSKLETALWQNEQTGTDRLSANAEGVPVGGDCFFPLLTMIKSTDTVLLAVYLSHLLKPLNC